MAPSFEASETPNLRQATRAHTTPPTHHIHGRRPVISRREGEAEDRRSAGVDLAGVVAEEGAFDHGDDGCLFVGWEVVEGFHA